LTYLVDTNVFSEQLKRSPDLRVVDWLRKYSASIYVSAVTIGELRRGIEAVDEGDRKRKFRTWLVDLGSTMEGGILSYNTSTAHIWGQLKVKWMREGITVSPQDGMIAATAVKEGRIMVSRDKIFSRLGIRVINPFD
jgi:predicted nucleic acid-binding protein